MADRSGSAPSGRVSTVDQPTAIRNVVLVGPSGAGKTTLIEALLYGSGTIERAGRVEDGTTTSDFDTVEIRQNRSVALTLEPIWVGTTKINLLDTPGYADFVGDLRAGLRAADAALFVVSAVDGVDGRSAMLWEECARVGMPRAVALTKIDHQRADTAGTVEQCRERFGPGVLPAYLPAYQGQGEDRDVSGLVGVLSGRWYPPTHGASEDSSPTPELPDDLAAEVATAREALVEGIIQESEDERLMEQYLAGEALDPDALIADLETAVLRGRFHPVLPVSGTRGIGISELLTEIPRACPNPTERPLPEVTTPEGAPLPELSCDPEGPLAAEVLKTSSDPYVGRISLVRVFSGTLRPDVTVHICGHGHVERGQGEHDTDERIGTVSSPLGKHTRPCGEVIAGDVCAVAKLASAETGDTISQRDYPLRISPWSFPEPLLPVALRPAAKSDEDRLAQAVSRIASEDLTLQVEVNPETHQLVLWCMGEAHLDVIMDRLNNRYGVKVETEPVRVPLRETFTVPAQGKGRNVKQTGGHGEYGICHIAVEPLPPGSGLEFVDKVVGGVVPRQYIPSVEKGIRAQMEQGVKSGYPVVDIRVTLYDGKSHSVDSSDMAFQKAGKLALKDAAENARVSMLEPVDHVTVVVDEDYVGAVMSDLSARRGRVLGNEPIGAGRVRIRAEVPELEISRYAIDLRSLSHGTGTFSREYLRHEPLPQHLAEKYTTGAAP
ncbi:elongation factor G-like protein EF-G2 [Lipingzhangella sp. LS1_29]|uniref:Elongation factor G-like protein EF-G2 n=1 Tax=Lipingzhangella rawalii TaxID=2055835 RepID=A0ABU2HA41_9ACTN|nr:elongation factor G-like protein EF-G2 [Lipingzhangella rawalii]MDS1272183.1 elongation factor G-like protein EF-G2 [Lipingzhangella rawalii]